VRVHVGDSELLQRLLTYFERHADCVVVQVGELEIEVALLGSYATATHDAAVARHVEQFHLLNGAARQPRVMTGDSAPGAHPA
jgi:hypothetical protein